MNFDLSQAHVPLALEQKQNNIVKLILSFNFLKMLKSIPNQLNESKPKYRPNL